MVNSEAIAVTLQKICTSSPSVRVSGSVTAGKLAEFHTRCSVPKMPQPIGQPAICTLCQSRVAQPFRGGADPKARRQRSRRRERAISSIESPRTSMLPGRGVGAREKPRNNPMRCRKLIHNSPPRRSTRDPQLNCYPPVVQLRRVSSKAAQARS